MVCFHLAMHPAPPGSNFDPSEASRRIALLEKFLEDLQELEPKATRGSVGQRTEPPRAITSKLNRSVEAVRAAVRDAGIETTVTSTPSALTGGPIQHADVFHNLFGRLHAGPVLPIAVGMVERAIGVYEHLRDQTGMIALSAPKAVDTSSGPPPAERAVQDADVSAPQVGEDAPVGVPSSRSAPMLTEPQHQLLEQLAADQLEFIGWIDGNALRMLGFDVQTVFATLPAGLVTIGGLPAPAEGYKLTLRGWLATSHAERISDAIQRLLAYMQRTLRSDRRKASFSWAEIKEGTGAQQNEYGIYWNALDAGRLWLSGHSVSASGERALTISKPPADELLDMMEWRTAEDVIANRDEWDRRRFAAMPASSEHDNSASHDGGNVVNVVNVVKNSVFVVFGHDEAAKEALHTFLRTLGINVITFDHARGSGSESNHEIVRNGIDSATAVIILFTPDEIAQRRPDLPGSPSPRHQPRPNVLFEAGWAFGAHKNKAIVVEVGMTHSVSDIDGINSVRMRDASSLNDLASRLERAGCSVDRTDSTWNSVARYPALFRPAPSLPAVRDNELEPEDLDDESLIQILRDKLPQLNSAFYTFRQLDEFARVPPGTAKRLAAQAARATDLLGEETPGGLRLTTPF